MSLPLKNLSRFSRDELSAIARHAHALRSDLANL